MILWTAEDEKTGASVECSFIAKSMMYLVTVKLGEKKKERAFPALFEPKEAMSEKDQTEARIIAMSLADELSGEQS